MKRIISVCLCLVVIATALVSCGKSTDVDVPYGLKLASDISVVDYYLFVPDDWTVDISTGVTTAYYSEADPSSISTSVYGLSDTVDDTDSYWEYYVGQFSDVFGNPENVEKSDIIIDGNPAVQYVYTTTFGETEYSFWQAVCTHNNRAYIITYASTAANYESHTADMQAVIESFKFMA